MRTLTLLAVLLLAVPGGGQEPVPPERRPGQFFPPAAADWVAFSAELEILAPGRPPQYGRHVQDEHGCRLREIPAADGDRVVTITNEQTNTTYRFARGQWTAQSMRPGPEPRRPTTRMAVDGRAPAFEGFDAFILLRLNPKEGIRNETVVIPALNYFEPVMRAPDGLTVTASRIVVGPQSHEQFHPPPGARVTAVAGIGGSMQFAAVVVAVTFPGETARELTTTEERPYEFTTPEGRTYYLVTTVTDWDTNEVRVRLVDNPKWSPKGLMSGDVLEEVRVTLGGTASTMRMPENFQLRITRVRERRAGR